MADFAELAERFSVLAEEQHAKDEKHALEVAALYEAVHRAQQSAAKRAAEHSALNETTPLLMEQVLELQARTSTLTIAVEESVKKAAEAKITAAPVARCLMCNRPYTAPNACTLVAKCGHRGVGSLCLDPPPRIHQYTDVLAACADNTPCYLPNDKLECYACRALQNFRSNSGQQ